MYFFIKVAKIRISLIEKNFPMIKNAIIMIFKFTVKKKTSIEEGQKVVGSTGILNAPVGF